MNGELERLKADLEVLERYHGYSILENARADLADKIDRLEADEADPWRDARERIEAFRTSTDVATRRQVAFVDHLTAENDRLAARVAELENEPEPAKVALKRAKEIKAGDVILAGGYIQTVTAIEPESTQRIIKCDGWMAWFRNNENVAVINGDDDPILDPARVLLTAIGILVGEREFRASASISDAMFRLGISADTPYRLKGSDK